MITTPFSAVTSLQKSCSYLYLPRLRNSDVMAHAIAAGASSRDFFGLASGKDGDRYLGFTYGEATSPFMDVALLIDPVKAAAYEEATRLPPAEPTNPSTAAVTTDGSMPSPQSTIGASADDTGPTTTAIPTHFWASAELNPVGTSLKFASIMNELVELFSARHGTNVVIKADIEASDSRGFDETTVSAAKEKSRVLGISSADFD